jgi:hypothetical protein
MGGPGSGRWYRWQARDTTDSHQSIDVRDWQRQGWLHTDGRFWWGGLTAQVQSGRVRLSYRIRRGDPDRRDIEDVVCLTWTPCHYGGQRPWFRCPGWGCGRRVAKLYLGGRYFRCRHCHDLAYESQREDRATRLISKAQKIRRQLGGSASLLEPFPPKPKGMHWRTYARLSLQSRRAGDTGLLVALAQLEHTPARIGSGIAPPGGRLEGSHRVGL